jgi:GH24 family phage-related lysozyme (muramidase)
MPPQQMVNFSRSLEIMQCEEHKPFSGTTFAEDEQRSGRPSATRTGGNTTRVGELVRSDRRLRVRMIADETNVNRETVRLILTEELGMRKICAKMVPRNLRQQQRDARLSAVFDIRMHCGDAAASLLT